MSRVLAIFGAFIASFNAYASFSVASSCGTSGNIDERIASCARPVEQGGQGEAAIRTYQNEHGETFRWRLVTQTREGRQVWRDETPVRDNEYAVWSDVADSNMHHWAATEYCDVPNRGEESKGHLKAKFKLPTGEEYRAAELHGIRQVLPNISERMFWAGDFISEAEALAFDSKDGSLTKMNRGSGLVSVRCTFLVKAQQ